MGKFQLAPSMWMECTILLELSYFKAFLDIFEIKKPRR